MFELNLQFCLIVAGILGFFAWRHFKFRSVKKQLITLLSQGALVVDVRSREEFQSGANQGSVNIPLGEIEGKISQLDQSKPIVLCCASGVRSLAAAALLRRRGFQNIVNAGSWRNTII